jgi:hypothetical protein
MLPKSQRTLTVEWGEPNVRLRTEFMKNPYCRERPTPLTIITEAIFRAPVGTKVRKTPIEGVAMLVAELVVGAIAFAATAAVTFFSMRPFWRRRNQIHLRNLLNRFAWQREQLEARFFDLAGGVGEPPGWRWENVDFAQAVSFARDRSTGRLSALVEVEIGLMPTDSPALAFGEEPLRRQHATAVFQVSRGRWVTKGRFLDNMSPREALHRFPDRYEALPQTTVR